MKKQFATLILLFFFNSLFAQVDRDKLSIEIRKLAGEWLSGFKNLKGAIKSDTETEAIYCSRMKMTGSKDSSNLIHFIKDRQLWSYTVDFDGTLVTAALLDSLIKEISFSFGNMEYTKTNINCGYGYVPANKKGVSENIRCFYLLVLTCEKDPLFKANTGLSLTVGEDDYFRSK